MMPRGSIGRQLRVFVSSTFQDMGAERSILVSKVFPMVADYCHRRKLELIGVDLRWGVSEEQSQRGETVSICMNEIDRSRPLFIGMLGERYGWVPEGSTVSVTEQEIRYGALDAPAGTEAFFYLRDTALTDELCGPFEADGRMEALRRAIRASGYSVLDGYQSLNEFARRAYEDLIAAVDRLTAGEEAVDPLQEARDEQFFLAARHAEGYVERVHLRQRLDDLVQAGGLVLVTGPVGVGKTALLARWALDLAEESQSPYLFLSFVGSAADKGWEQLARQLVGELKQHFSLDYPDPTSKEELRRALYILLQMAARQGRVVLAIDQLDALALDDGFGLSWLPEDLPDGVSVVVTADEGDVMERLRARPHAELPVEALTSDEAVHVAQSYLAAYAKTLGSEHLALIGASEQARNPLYLITLLNEVRAVGHHEWLTDQLMDYLSCKDARTLFDKVLSRIDADFDEAGDGLPRRMLALMDASRGGLTEAELVSLLGEVPQAWFAPLRLALEPFTAVSGGALHVMVSEFAQAVRSHYGLGPAEQAANRTALTSWFMAHRDTPRRSYMLPWLLAQAGEWKRLAQVLAEPDCFAELWQRSRAETKQYWAAAGASGYRAVDGYRAVLDEPAACDAGLLVSLAEFLFETGEAKAAQTLLASLTGEGSRADDRRRGAAFGLLGNLYQQQGQLELAERCYRTKFDIFQRLGDQYEQQRALGNIGLINLMQGDLAEAREAFESVLELAESLNQRDGQQVALGNLGNIAFAQGDIGKAKALFERQRAISFDSGNAAGLINACGALGVLYCRMGDTQAAWREFTEQKEQSRSLGAVDGLSNALGNLATVAHQRGEVAQAKQLLQDKLALCQRSGQFVGEQNALGNLADLAFEQGEYQEALRYGQQRAELTKRHRAFRAYADALHRQSLAEQALGMQLEAKQHRLEAEGIAKQQGFSLG